VVRIVAFVQFVCFFFFFERFSIGYSNIVNGEIEMEVNKNWLVDAGVTTPLVLRSVSVFDADAHVPLDTLPETHVENVQLVFSNKRKRLANAKPTEGC
jgi:hypothetical protein